MTIVVALIVAVAAVSLVPSTPPGRRVHNWIEALSNRQYDVIFSQRLPPFLAAAEMCRDHPLTGVGPGCFKVHYMSYRLKIDAEYPRAWLASYPEMFAEAHNDHLQLLAEAGIPAYALFLFAIGAIALPAIRIRPVNDLATADFRHVFARELRLPLAAAIFIVALAQFPLQLAAPRTMFLYFAALCFAWDQHAA
jgi:O-antigen ligase